MKQATYFKVHAGWQLLLRDMGFDAVELLKRSGLPTDLFKREDATVSVAQYFNLWEALEDQAGSHVLPLLIGQHISVEAFDPPLFAVFCSPNLNTALDRLSHYKRLVGPMILRVDHHPRFTQARLSCYQYEGRIPRSIALTESVFLTKLARMATRQHIVPREVVVSELPADPRPFESFLGVPMKAGKGNWVSFHAEDAQRPFLTDNPRMWDFFEKELQQRLHELDGDATLTERVRGVLLEMLPAGESTIEFAAQRLAISKRSLQRHLSGEGINFQQLLKKTRESLAHHYLVNSRLSQGEISFLLGFQDTNSFIRAYSQWTGISPGQYRART